MRGPAWRGVWVRLKRVETIDSSKFTLYPCEFSVSKNHSWHQCPDRLYGNVAHVSGGAPAGEDRVHTHTTYACRNDAGATSSTSRATCRCATLRTR